MNQFHRIDKVKVSEAVYDQLRQLIVRQEQEPGSKLPSEKKLSELFGVSRATVRSAIQRLAAEGMVETINGDGTYVRDIENTRVLISMDHIKSAQILEILEFRIAIDMLSADLAAQRATKTQLMKLHDIVETMRSCIETNDRQQYSIADMKFHVYLAEISGNSLVKATIETFSDYFFRHFIEMNDNIGLEFGFDHHWRIYQAIVDGDSETAQRLVKENINRSIYKVKTWPD